MSTSQIKVESFDTVPSISRVGGSRTPSESLQTIRDLKPKQKAVFVAAEAEDFDKFTHRINGKLYRKGALSFKPIIRVDKANKKVEVYRVEGNDYKTNEDGTLALNDKGRPYIEQTK